MMDALQKHIRHALLFLYHRDKDISAGKASNELQNVYVINIANRMRTFETT